MPDQPSSQPKVDLVQEHLNELVMRAIQAKAMAPAERADLYALARFMHLNDRETSEQVYLHMYLEGDRDWRKDFEKVFGHRPGVDKDSAT